MGNRAYCVGRALHHVAPEAAMHMQVNHTRQRNQVAGVHIRRLDRLHLCGVIGFPRDNPSFVYNQRAVRVALSVRYQRATVNPKRHARSSVPYSMRNRAVPKRTMSPARSDCLLMRCSLTNTPLVLFRSYTTSAPFSKTIRA